MVIGFVEVETPAMRVFRHAATGMSVDDIIAEPRTLWIQSGIKGDERFHFWCAADEPESDHLSAFAPVYRTTELPEGACCEECGIELADLQRELTRAIS
jgi:hypothetical protein